jgi:hypothetical protein
MKYVFFLIIAWGCHEKQSASVEDRMNEAIESGDTTLAKKLAQQELAHIRSSVTDSEFALFLDIGTRLQTMEFEVRKRDARENLGEHENRLYDLMMRAYRLAIGSAKRNADVERFSKEINIEKEAWWKKYFVAKTMDETLRSLKKFQRDAALISAIVNGGDTDEFRNQIAESYKEAAD